MDKKWEVEMFINKFTNLTEEELFFLNEVNDAPSVGNNGFNMAEKYKVMSTFYLAKQIEESSISNDKHSKAMKNLTIILVFVGIIQAISAFAPNISNLLNSVIKLVEYIF